MTGTSGLYKIDIGADEFTGAAQTIRKLILDKLYVAEDAACVFDDLIARRAELDELSRVFGLRRGEALWVKRRHIDREEGGLLFTGEETKSGRDERAFGGGGDPVLMKGTLLNGGPVVANRSALYTPGAVFWLVIRVSHQPLPVVS